MKLKNIRNFCIIAHIDHGKSTLADRFLEVTGTVAMRDMKEQLLDQMDIERERGITVKLAPVRMQWRGMELNLIDTPGHVDFTYEVSRSLAAVEGALLVVDATQGVQAQTIANLDLAKQQGLVIIPIINKIDLPAANIPLVTAEIVKLTGCDPASIIQASAKEGIGIETILDRVIRDVPFPTGQPEAPLRALIFDSTFNTYKGVVAYVRIIDGQIGTQGKITLVSTAAGTVALEVGTFAPQLVPGKQLEAGEIGYIVTGLKEVGQARVGDTVATSGHVKPLPGYREVKPMVFAGVFTNAGDEYPQLREAMEKLKLNDAALAFEPEHSPALGYGFRCGFLGLLHMDIIRERLQREFDLNVLVTVPSVAYHVFTAKNSTEPLIVRSPLELPDPSQIERIEEPIMAMGVVTPSSYIGAVMQATQERRGQFQNLEYLDAERAILHFSIPLSSILVDFYDTLKSVTSGYASLNYELSGYAAADVIRLDILVASDPVDALSSMVYRDESYRAGRAIVAALKPLLPRQMFEVKIQAAIGGKIIASEHLPAMRKDVTAKLYGGDVTRKRKLLEKQKKGKKRMKAMGKVEIPQSAFLAVLKR